METLESTQKSSQINTNNDEAGLAFHCLFQLLRLCDGNNK